MVTNFPTSLWQQHKRLRRDSVVYSIEVEQTFRKLSITNQAIYQLSYADLLTRHYNSDAEWLICWFLRREIFSSITSGGNRTQSGKGPSIKDVRSQGGGGCQCGQRGKEGRGLSQCGHFADKGVGESTFCDFVRTSFMEAPNSLPSREYVLRASFAALRRNDRLCLSTRYVVYMRVLVCAGLLRPYASTLIQPWSRINAISRLNICKVVRNTELKSRSISF